jgi:hypothetical protein
MTSGNNIWVILSLSALLVIGLQAVAGFSVFVYLRSIIDIIQYTALSMLTLTAYKQMAYGDKNTTITTSDSK